MNTYQPTIETLYIIENNTTPAEAITLIKTHATKTEHHPALKPIQEIYTVIHFETEQPFPNTDNTTVDKWLILSQTLLTPIKAATQQEAEQTLNNAITKYPTIAPEHAHREDYRSTLTLTHSTSLKPAGEEKQENSS